jgi:nucleoside-diphosphate-sugar epimerase/SAM-dependent methyltransferase
MLNILIIGHKGYIGSYIYDFIKHNSQGIQLDGADKIDGEEFIGKNIQTINQYDIVIYLGGLTGRNVCADKTVDELFDGNVVDIMTVSENMKQGSLLIYASTAGLYEGFGHTEGKEDDMLYTDLFDKYVQSMYWREQNIQTLTHINTIGLRFGTVIGLSPNQRHDLCHIGMLKSAILKGHISVCNPNTNRAILWNYDLLSIISLFILKREIIQGNHVFNLSSINCTIAKIANEIACITGCNLDYKENNDKQIGFSMSNKKLCDFLKYSFVANNNAFIINELLKDPLKVCKTTLKKVDNICRVCKENEMIELLDLGNHNNANHYLQDNNSHLDMYPLQLIKCMKCHHLQLAHTIPPEKMFSDYIYLSGTSNTLRSYFKDFVDKVCLQNTGTVLEIACNDGSLLDEFSKKGWKTYGYDPAKNIYEISSKKGHSITVGFWGNDKIPEYPELDIIVAQNVLAHVPDPILFLQKCKQVMSDNTILYIQTSQANLIQEYQFDTIYHEHLSYFNIHSMNSAVESVGLSIYNVEKVDIHGVSYLFTIKKQSNSNIYKHPLYIEEKELGLYDELLYFKYIEKVKMFKTNLLRHIRSLSKYPLFVYGSSAKGMTILNYLEKIPIKYIVDDSHVKQGLYATNYKYLIKSPIELSNEEDTVVILVLAWNFFEEIKQKMMNIRKGKKIFFICPFPKMTIYLLENDTLHKKYEEFDYTYKKESIHKNSTLICHFYNEEFLLPFWIRHHANHFDKAILINHNSTDNSIKIIEKEAPTSWKIINTSLPNFGAYEVDQEVTAVENSIEDTSWKIALNVTEFLMSTPLRHKDTILLDSNAIGICMRNIIQSDFSFVNASLSLPYQINELNEDLLSDKRYLHNYIHHNLYKIGRHEISVPSIISNNMLIFKYQHGPYPYISSRKLQIKNKIPVTDVVKTYGWHHQIGLKDLIKECKKENKNISQLNIEENEYNTLLSIYKNLYNV